MHGIAFGIGPYKMRNLVSMPLGHCSIFLWPFPVCRIDKARPLCGQAGCVSTGRQGDGKGIGKEEGKGRGDWQMVLLYLTSLAPHRNPIPPIGCSPHQQQPALPRRLRAPALRRLRRPTRRPASAPAVTVTTTPIAAVRQVQEEGNRTSGTYPKWGEFASRVSGEWDGYGAEFTSKGEPIELPENVVPEAFREWGVQVFDWQTQCPSLAEAGKPSLVYKLIKLLPTVGCEADAATRHSVEEKMVGGADSKVSAFAYDQSGSYVALWALEGYNGEKLLEVEHCLVDPSNCEVRMRIVQKIRVEKTMMELRTINVFSEQWYGPFRNGEQLGGCAIGESGFAATGAMKESEVLGMWQSACVSATFRNAQAGAILELVDNRAQKLIRDQQNLVTLPKQLWCSVGKREDNETCAEVGWLVDRGRAVTSRCIFTKDGNLKEVSVGHEAAILGDM